MKKIVFLSLLLFTTTAAQFSINLGTGADFYTIDGVEKTDFLLWNGTPAYIEREEISNPLYLNLQFEYKSGSLIYGLHFAGAYKTYHVKYHYFDLGPYLDTDDFSEEDDVPWARAEINGVVLYEANLSESLSLLFGAGGGLQIMPPVLSEKFIFETTYHKALNLDFSDDVELEYLPNAKLVVRAKIKLNKHFHIFGETNYLFVQKGKYEQPSEFLTVALFLGCSF